MTIQKWLTKKKVSQAEFARRIEVSPVFVHYMLGGFRKPSKYLALMIEKVTEGDIKARSLRKDITL